MVAEFSIIEWNLGPEADLSLVRVGDQAVGEPFRVQDPHELLREPRLACFRLEELSLLRPDWLPGLKKKPGIADAVWLARVAAPTEDSFELPALARKFGLEPRCRNGADRARMAGRVWLALKKHLGQQPLAVLAEMEKLLEPTRHFLREIVGGLARESVKRGFGRRGRSIEELLPDDALNSGRFHRGPPRQPPLPINTDEIVSMFLPEGLLARSFGAYEYRPEQVRMVKEVCDALNDGLVLMVEAGTGTGKSLAYLSPAIVWSVKNNDPVIVSTNTKNLQAQLFQKDLPFLETALGGSFRYALIKGRANYLCIRKLLIVLGAADRELSDSERIELLPVISWLSETKSGDVGENAGFKPGMGSELWSRISTVPDECLGGRCRWSRRCFVRRARALAAQSDIVVANHATVFSEGETENVALPAHRCIVFDEAHNLEDVATDCFTIQVAPWQVPRILNRLFRGRRGAGRGLFANLQYQLYRERRLAGGRTEELSKLVETCRGSLPGLRGASDALFGAVRWLFNEAGTRGDRIRYDADHRPENWPAVAQAASELKDLLRELADRLELVDKHVETCVGKGRGDGSSRTVRDVAAEVGSQALHLRKIVEALDTVVKGEDEAFVYWAQRGSDRTDVSLCAAPLDITELMNRAVYSKMRTAVFTSATLTVRKNFEFMRDRLGMRGEVSSRVHTADLGTSFDFRRQVLFAVPVFLPEPRAGGPDFVKPFCRLCVELLRATSGRGLVLFTSHAMLREAGSAIKSALAPVGIRVLVQGVDGERSRLAALFSRETSSVLLGTQSFWEGMDVPGEALSCLVLAKLPFRPHTDPIVSARCELLESRGQNPFLDYMVPDAVIRLKQGFGRLVRSREDSGVVLLCDGRVVTRAYGRAFRESLPVEMRTFTDQTSLLTSIREFLGKRRKVNAE